jgi:hypothetical protein
MQFAYLAAGIIMLTIWAILFIHRKDLRREMLVMSAIAAPLGLFDFFAVPLYWQPVTMFGSLYNIENILYTFSLGGITSVLYSEVARKAPRHMHTWHKSAALIVGLVTLAVLVFVAVQGTFNPAISLYVALLIGLGVTLYFRKDLVRGTIIGAICFGIVYFVALKLWMTLFPEAVTWFVFEGMPKAYVWGVPLWELTFGIIFAAYWGNIYEILFGYRLVRKTRHSIK